MNRPLMMMLLSLILMLFNSDVLAEIYVITSHRTPVRAVTIAELKDIYLGRTVRFSNGAKAYPIELSDQSTVKQAFHQQVTERTLDQLAAHWARLMFTGKGYPIETVDSETAVLNFVTNNPDSIGYVSIRPSGREVKIILVLPDVNRP